MKYTFSKKGEIYFINIVNGQKIVASIKDLCEKEDIKAGIITGIGATNDVSLRFFDPETKEYVDKNFKEQMEISNLSGNISEMDGQVYLHFHITLGREDYTALAGHLLEATINGAGEFAILKAEGRNNRIHHPDLKLNLYDF